MSQLQSRDQTNGGDLGDLAAPKRAARHVDPNDGLDLYFRDMGKAPLLTAEAERDLMRRSVEGDKEAREKLITSNLRLVVSVARQFSGRGVSLEDLIGAGNQGLVRAIDRLDPAHGCKLATYATWWIKKEMFDLLESRRPIRIPNYIYKMTTRVKAELDKRRETDPGATIEEVAADMGINPYRVSGIKHALTTLSQVRTTALATTEKEMLVELLPDREHEDDFGNAPRNDRLDLLIQILEAGNGDKPAYRVLDRREEEILKRRFGIGGFVAASQTQVGADVGITKQRVSQIETRALRRLSKYIREAEA